MMGVRGGEKKKNCVKNESVGGRGDTGEGESESRAEESRAFESRLHLMI